MKRVYKLNLKGQMQETIIVNDWDYNFENTLKKILKSLEDVEDMDEYVEFLEDSLNNEYVCDYSDIVEWTI